MIDWYPTKWQKENFTHGGDVKQTVDFSWKLKISLGGKKIVLWFWRFLPAVFITVFGWWNCKGVSHLYYEKTCYLRQNFVLGCMFHCTGLYLIFLANRKMKLDVRINKAKQEHLFCKHDSLKLTFESSSNTSCLPPLTLHAFYLTSLSVKPVCPVDFNLQKKSPEML